MEEIFHNQKRQRMENFSLMMPYFDSLSSILKDNQNKEYAEQRYNIERKDRMEDAISLNNITSQNALANQKEMANINHAHQRDMAGYNNSLMMGRDTHNTNENIRQFNTTTGAVARERLGNEEGLNLTYNEDGTINGWVNGGNGQALPMKLVVSDDGKHFINASNGQIVPRELLVNVENGNVGQQATQPIVRNRRHFVEGGTLIDQSQLTKNNHKIVKHKTSNGTFFIIAPVVDEQGNVLTNDKDILDLFMATGVSFGVYKSAGGMRPSKYAKEVVDFLLSQNKGQQPTTDMNDLFNQNPNQRINQTTAHRNNVMLDIQQFKR